MQKNLFGALLMLCSIYLTQAAFSSSLPRINPDYPDQCWDAYNKKAYSVGVHYPPHSCMEIHCTEDYSMTQATCGILLPPPGYTNEIDHTKKYPACCVNLKKIKNEVDAEFEGMDED